jgi:predicted RNase H-like HicB family nuclease
MRKVDMLTALMNAAMRIARYEILPEGEGNFGNIMELQGVWANADSLEACREALQEVLEEWIILGLKKGHHIPEINGIRLDDREADISMADRTASRVYAHRPRSIGSSS